MLEYREGYLWPQADTELWRVAHDYTILNMAIGFCKQRRGVIQAGGACGTFPAWLAERFEMVYTFEPDSTNFTCLAMNAQQGNVLKFQAALGPDQRNTTLEREKPNNAGTSYVTSGTGSRTIAGDALELPNIDLIQLDTEGFEYSALYGLRQTIARDGPVIVIEQKHSARYGLTADAVVNLIKGFGYEQVANYARDIIFKRVGS